MGDSKKKVAKKMNNKNISNLDKKANAATKETIELPFIPKNFAINSCQQMDVNCAQSSVKEGSVSPEESDVKCSGCENMAKNFLYLQSLISTNYVPNKRCDVCYSALQYLQYVNENLVKVFGNFDSVAEAGKAFANLGNNCEKQKVAKPKSRLPKARSVSASMIKAASVKKPPRQQPAKPKKAVATKLPEGNLILKTRHFSKLNAKNCKNRVLITRNHGTNSNLNQTQKLKRK
uniref:Uncharacterized protein n=1 Tax=Glossina palpalis gambiensis TaxID=67801 RepID=A0A1B0BQK7_9MUSC